MITINKNGIDRKIALTEKELVIVTDILKNYPNAIVFGSRIKGTSKKFSDLDLCLKEPISGAQHELLKEAFENSDLPFTVDLIIYSQVDNAFKKIIDREGFKLMDFLKKK